MANEPRYWEDYLLGSSDNPKISGAHVKLRELGKIGIIIQTLSAKQFKPDFTLDVEQTNEYRIIHAKSKAPPIIKEKNVLYFRKINWDENGLFCVEYSSDFPVRMEVFKDEELVPVGFAAEYLDINIIQIKEMVKDGKLRGTRYRVNLSDLNKYKK